MAEPDSTSEALRPKRLHHEVVSVTEAASVPVVDILDVPEGPSP